MSDAKKGAAGVHRGVNLAFASIGGLVLLLTLVHLVASVELVRLAGAAAVVAVGWFLVLRVLQRTS